MKRSEMLEKMVVFMELHNDNDPGWLDCHPNLKQNALDYASKVLRDLEDEGMKPPLPSSCPTKGYSIDHKWEDETDS